MPPLEVAVSFHSQQALLLLVLVVILSLLLAVAPLSLGEKF
jgi:hypothetical protein